MVNKVAAYPKADPVAKHDILCPASILQVVIRSTATKQEQHAVVVHALDSLITSMNESSIAPPPSSLSPSNDVITKVATVYTYPDAPTHPAAKPLSRAPRIYKLVTRTLMNQWTAGTSSNSTPLHKCTIGVKLPSRIPPGDTASQSNSSSFRTMVQSLCEMKLVAMLACDSSARIGFLVPNDISSSSSSNDDSDSDITDNHNYAAYLYYAPMNEFISWLQSTIAAINTTTHSPETWTPQYTPPHEEEEECIPRGWDDNNNINDPSTWTPQYTPPPEEKCCPSNCWDEVMKDGSSKNNTNHENISSTTAGLFVPTATTTTTTTSTIDECAGLWGWDDNRDEMNTANDNLTNDNDGWDMLWNKCNNNSSTKHNAIADTNGDDAKALPSFGAIIAETSTTFEQRQQQHQQHVDSGAAAADAFYSGLTRSLDTRADSRLFHMRNFNGWIKATLIAELDPDTSSTSRVFIGGITGGKKRSRTSPLRVLDLACGKGGDLGKWTIHQRKIENYVGIDVARGSLVDAAKRARQMCSKKNSSLLRKCTFTLADLGEDVPGRKRNRSAVEMQKLPTWSLQTESSDEGNSEPIFLPKEGGGIAETDKFDVVSIQFAIHYMMSTRKRARRFFHTVSSLLEIGGNLIATTIDARVVIEKLMGLGIDYHFDDLDVHEDVNTSSRKSDNVTVSVGQGVCKLKFETDTLRKVFQHTGDKSLDDMLFGLQYTFTLVEGSDHAAGVGEAVDLPEWLTPIAALEELAKESGLKLEYVSRK